MFAKTPDGKQFHITWEHEMHKAPPFTGKTEAEFRAALKAERELLKKHRRTTCVVSSAMESTVADLANPVVKRTVLTPAVAPILTTQSTSSQTYKAVKSNVNGEEISETRKTNYIKEYGRRKTFHDAVEKLYGNEQFEESGASIPNTTGIYAVPGRDGCTANRKARTALWEAYWQRLEGRDSNMAKQVATFVAKGVTEKELKSFCSKYGHALQAGTAIDKSLPEGLTLKTRTPISSSKKAAGRGPSLTDVLGSIMSGGRGSGIGRVVLGI